MVYRGRHDERERKHGEIVKERGYVKFICFMHFPIIIIII